MLKKYWLLLIAMPIIGINLYFLFITSPMDRIPYGHILLALNSLLLLIISLFQSNKPEPSEDKLTPNTAVDNLPAAPQDIVVEHLPNFLCLKDAQGRWLRANQTYLASFNLEAADYFGKTDLELMRQPDSDQMALKLSSIQDKSAWHLGAPQKETRTILTHAGGKETYLEITRTPVFDKVGKKLSLLLTGSTLEPDRQPAANAEDVIQAFQDCHLSLVFLDANLNITATNAAFCELTGYKIDELLGKPLSVLIDHVIAPSIGIKNDQDTPIWLEDHKCKHKEGHFFPIKLDITPLTKNQTVTYFVSIFDITRQKQSEKRIMQIAHYDDLTGLVNRVMFFDRLSQCLSAAKRHRFHAVVFFIDLDRFKQVNDTLGHDAGDQLLKETSVRLLSAMRSEDVVARLSGDEFALLLLNEKTYEQAIYSASMVSGKVIQTLSEVFLIQRREVFIGASIGIAIYPEDGLTAEALLKNADIAMYEAKKQGRNNYQFYKKDYSVASQDRLATEFNLRKAIEKNELQLYFQPQYEAASHILCGAEVLIRWFQGPAGQTKMIPPDYFIKIAEETGMIIELGEWILKAACKQMKTWLTENYPLQQLSVNVSTRQFNDANFIMIVEEALNEAGLSAEYLELEITESLLMGDIKHVDLTLQRLKKMGIKIALDDFGTGYSSLSYLKIFPIDVLKIDQSFIREMTLDSKDARIVCAIIEMGHSLGQIIVAEGVETEQQLMYLKHRGCDIIQGYYFSPPLPEYKMTALLISEMENAQAGETKLKPQAPKSPFQTNQ